MVCKKFLNNRTEKKKAINNESKEILCETLDEEPEFWNCVEVKQKDKNEKTINDNN